MKNKGAGKHAKKRPVVLVFGESDNDTKAVRHLVEGLRPDLSGIVEPRRHPLVLIKNATPERAKNNAQRIASVVRHEMVVRNVLGVLAHEDCDAVEPAHVAAAEKIERELKDALCECVTVAVTPAWEMEAWWMVFPEAVGQIVKGWRDPDDWIGKNVGVVPNAKECLARAVQPRRRQPSPPREYEEHDSIQIAANVMRDGLLASFQDGRRASHATNGVPRLTLAASFEAFRAKILALPEAS